MLKTLTFWVIILWLIISLTGCFDIESNSNYDFNEKILGKWLANDNPEGEDGSIIFHFLRNNTFYINLTEKNDNGNYTTQTTSLKYNITKENLTMFIADEKVILDYTFSNNFKTLTIKEENGTPTILKKPL